MDSTKTLESRSNPFVKSLPQLSKFLVDMIKSDRWALIQLDGRMGEGKSVCALKLAKCVSEMFGKEFKFSVNITYSRKELLILIDGEGENKAGQLPMYSVILVDEMISLFNKRNWQDVEQNEVIELFNKIRDRHLLIIGCTPNFWDMDKSLRELATLWVHVQKRGDGQNRPTLSYVFKPSDNPFIRDKWQRDVNEKKYRQFGANSCNGYVCSLLSDALEPYEEEEYLKIRNSKRNDEMRKEKEKKQIKKETKNLYSFDKKE